MLHRSSWQWMPSATSLRSFIQSSRSLTRTPTSPWTNNNILAVVSSNASSIYANLAAEEAILRGVVLHPGEGLLFMYRNEPCVVVGRNQNIFQEVSMRGAAVDGVNVARRSSGGGAVYHDRGNLCFSFFAHRQDYAPHKSIQVLRLGLSALCGVDLQRLTTTKRDDLFLDGKKITGSAMRVQRDISFHHCTLLISSCRAHVGKYLRSEGAYERFETSSVGSVRSPVTTLCDAGVFPAEDGSKNDDGDDDVVAHVQHFMSRFYLQHGNQILRHAAPWELHLTDLHDVPPMVELPQSTAINVDVLSAVHEEEEMILGDGRRLSRGDAATVCEEVQRLSSVEWLFAMPPFTSVVAMHVEELCIAMRADAAHALHDAQGVKDEVLLRLLEPIFGVDGGGAKLHVATRVERRIISEVSVHVATNADEVEVPWLQNFLRAMLCAKPCDADVLADVRELNGAAAMAVLRGFYMEAQELYPQDIDDDDVVANNLHVLMLVRALLSTWRRKNGFHITAE